MPYDDFHIIESTLREGEQFSTGSFNPDQKRRIAHLLDEFGVEFIEMTSPVASPQSEKDIRMLVDENLNAKTLTHIRCNKQDAEVALQTGVDGLDIVIGTSPQLMEHSHGKSIRQIIDMAEDVLTHVREQRPDMILRFSTEDSFRSRKADVFTVYLAISNREYKGRPLVDRFGVADTVGVARPTQVYKIVQNLVEMTHTAVEFHGHNDSGCAIANAAAALEGGATHIDTTILGIGERNGITSLGGLIARIYTIDKANLDKYNLEVLPRLDALIADYCNVDIPFSNPITGSSAFMHKAGIHAKAVLANPETYEIIRPEDFGLTRSTPIGHRLTGWNAIADRARTLGLAHLDKTALREVTAEVKRLADDHPLSLEEVDTLLYQAAKKDHQSVTEAATD